MFSVNFNKISVKEFARILKSIDLLPGRRILLTDIDTVVKKLDDLGITTLVEVRMLLKKKSEYESVAQKLHTTADYLAVLNREINGYESKPVELSRLEIIPGNLRAILLARGFKTTKDMYESLQTKKQRKEFCATIPGGENIDEKTIAAALEIADLLRINGVGQTYALMLREIGITSPEMYAKTDSQTILARIQELNREKNITKANLGIKDIEYCKRFCAFLD